MKTVLKGKEWNDYLKKHNIRQIGQMELYSGVTWNFQSIYKIGKYFFTFSIKRGYTNISALKRLL